MLVYIARHGETEWNRTGRTQGIQNIELTSTGRKQAQCLSNRLKNEQIKQIYCSDLKRAHETACIIGKTLDIVPVLTPLLREACFGRWEGCTIQEISSCYPGDLKLWQKDFSFCPPQGESISEVHQRVKDFIKGIDIKGVQKDEGILLVSHSLTSKVLIMEMTGLPIQYLNRIRVDNAALSIVEISEDRNRIILLNDTCHLRG